MHLLFRSLRPNLYCDIIIKFGKYNNISLFSHKYNTNLTAWVQALIIACLNDIKFILDVK
jgi:hypothetical protein